MLVHSLIVGLFLLNVESVLRNETCPAVTPRELDWKEATSLLPRILQVLLSKSNILLDGTWYIAAIATDLQVQGDCAMVLFDHQNTTDVSISWITNNTVAYYNGSVSLIPDPNSNTTGDLLMVTYDDQKTETYSFLDVNYEHYAVLFACYNNDDGNSSTYEIWKLTRTPHLKVMDKLKLDQAVANYSLQDTQFYVFNNTEDSCRVNAGLHLDPSSVVMAAATAISMLRRLY